MKYLLKIVEGPMKGAEIALVEGMSATFGSGDDCDIVVQDATVPAVACTLETEAGGVKLAIGGSAASVLPDFEVRSFGTTSFAVGPVDGDWTKLVKPVVPQPTRSEPEPAPASETAPAAEPEAKEPEKEEKKSSHGCLFALVFLLLLVLLAVLAWYYWPQIAKRYPKVEEVRVACVEKTEKVCDFCVEKVKGWMASDQGRQKAAPAPAQQTLAEIASAHHLSLNLQPQPLLSGNLRRRTERLAIRALALRANPKVTFDLTDDESLLSSASELIFAATDGAMKVLSATNRVVALGGYAPSLTALESAVRALDADVKGIVKVDTTKVVVGGTAPAAVAQTPFVRQTATGERPVAVIPVHTPNPPRAKVARDYPIAGILTAPYPCVVMRNGMRLVEGAQIGNGTVLKRIEGDRLVLVDGGREIIWRP